MHCLEETILPANIFWAQDRLFIRATNIREDCGTPCYGWLHITTLLMNMFFSPFSSSNLVLLQRVSLPPSRLYGSYSWHCLYTLTGGSPCEIPSSLYCIFHPFLLFQVLLVFLFPHVKSSTSLSYRFDESIFARDRVDYSCWLLDRSFVLWVDQALSCRDLL